MNNITADQVIEQVREDLGINVSTKTALGWLDQAQDLDEMAAWDLIWFEAEEEARYQRAEDREYAAYQEWAYGSDYE